MKWLCLILSLSSCAVMHTNLEHSKNFKSFCSIDNRVLWLQKAQTKEERARGLMYQKELLPSHGMIFVFDQEGFYSFWMKNTLMNLDLIFLNKNFEVVHTVENAQAYSTTPIESPVPFQYTIEVTAGFLKVHALKGLTLTCNL